MKSKKPYRQIASRALFKSVYMTYSMSNFTTSSEGQVTVPHGWDLSEKYYFSFDEAKAAHGGMVVWPVIINDDGRIYSVGAEE